MERADVFEAFQLGPEATVGAGASAFYRLLGSEATLDPEFAHTNHKPKNSKFVTFQTKGQEYAKGSFQGATSLFDLLFMINGLAQSVVTTPTHNNVFSVTLGGATGGNFTLTFNSVATANIAYNANAAAVKAALAAISTIGEADNVTVTGLGTNVSPFIITLLSDVAMAGALTANFAGLTGATSPGISTTAGGTVRRWTSTISPFAADTPQTYHIQKGNAAESNAAEESMMVHIQSLNIKMGLDDSTYSADFFGQKIVQPITMSGTVSDLPIAPIEPRCVNVYLGKAVSGTSDRPVLLNRVFDFELALGPKYNPLRTLNCNVDGIAAAVEVQMNSTLNFSVENDGELQSIITNAREGDLMYVIVDAIGAAIPSNTAYSYRLRIFAPIFVSTIQRDEMEGVYTAKINADIAYSGALGRAIRFQIDIDDDAF